MRIQLLPTLLACAALSLGAQDVMKAAPNHYKVRVENEHVRVVENTLAPGEKDPVHTHAAGWYYVTKPGKMKVTHADGKSEIWEAKEGEAGWMEAEGPHTSENVGTTTMGFILVEVKSAAK
jgi:quercetin dioxygenase-like cupin family protein